MPSVKGTRYYRPARITAQVAQRGYAAAGRARGISSRFMHSCMAQSRRAGPS